LPGHKLWELLAGEQADRQADRQTLALPHRLITQRPSNVPLFLPFPLPSFLLPSPMCWLMVQFLLKSRHQRWVH